MSVFALLAFLNSELSWGSGLNRLVPGALPASTEPRQPGIPAQDTTQKTPAANAPQPPKGDQTVVQVPLPGESELEITVVEGEDGSNVVGKKSSSPPSVTVRDAKKQPIEGAVVTFIAPADGPSVVFGNGERTVTVLTDADGKAQVPRMKAVNAGSFKLQVSASFHGQVVNAAISQTNFESGNQPPGDKTKGPAKNKSGLSGGMLAVIIGGGAAAAIGIGLGLGHKGSSSSSPSTTTSATIGAPGTPVAGPP